jgi:hypothetical protein
VKSPVATKPYKPFEAKHKEAARKAAQTAAKVKTAESDRLYPEFGIERESNFEKQALKQDFQKDIPLALQVLHTHHKQV